MAFYFFTEPMALENQTSVQNAFGPQEVQAAFSTHFQVTSIHSATKNPYVYAVCEGSVRYQYDDTNPNLLTAVLRPSQRVVEGLPIIYFIYRGILKTSVISNINTGELVAKKEVQVSATSVHLTDRIHFYQEQANLRNGTAESPNAVQLGTGFTATAPYPYTRSDQDLIHSIFFENSDIKPASVNSGTIIGQFDKDHFGFEVVLDSISNDLTIAELRKVSLLPDPANANLPGKIIKAVSADELVNKLSRERILNYLDPCAFFGRLYKDGVQLKDDGSNATIAKEGNLITKIIDKFLNKNTQYVDIRNENGLSFNYYSHQQIIVDLNQNLAKKNASENVLLRQVNPLVPIEYETYSWPLKIIKKESVTLTPGSSQTAIRIALPVGEVITATTRRIVYLNYSSFYYNNLNVQKGPEFDPQYRFADLIKIDTVGADTYTPDFTLTSFAANFKNAAGADVLSPVCAYHKLMYIKQHATNWNAANANVETYSNLDNLFTVKDVDKYSKWSTGRNSSQYFLTAQEKYVFSEDGNVEGIVQAGVAIDVKGTAATEKRITFFHILASQRKPGQPPVRTKAFAEGSLNDGILRNGVPVPTQYESFFLKYHTGRFSTGREDLILEKKVLKINPDPVNIPPNTKVFLNYAQNGEIDKKNKLGPYTSNSFNAISLSFAEYNKLTSLRNAGNYDVGYHPVFIQKRSPFELVPDNAEDIPYYKFNLRLAGLTKTGATYTNRKDDVPEADVSLQGTDKNLLCTQEAALFEPVPISKVSLPIEFFGSAGKTGPDYLIRGVGGDSGELPEFLQALEDIRTYNPRFYGALQRALIFGVSTYRHDKPDVKVLQYPKIYVELAALAAGQGGETTLTKNGGFIHIPAAPVVLEGHYKAPFPGANPPNPFFSTDRFYLGCTGPLFDSPLKADGVIPEQHDQFINAKRYRDLNKDNSIPPSKIDDLFIPFIEVGKLPDLSIPAFLKGQDYTNKYESQPIVNYEQALRLGFGSTNGSTFIKIDQTVRNQPNAPEPKCAFFNSRRFSFLKIISHELGHALANIQLPLRCLIWNELEEFYNGSSNSKNMYPATLPDYPDGDDRKSLIKIPDEISTDPKTNPPSFPKSTINPLTRKYDGHIRIDTIGVQGTFTGDRQYDTDLHLRVAPEFKSKFGTGHLRGNISGNYSAVAEYITHLNYWAALDAEVQKNGGAAQPLLSPKCGYLYNNLDLKVYYVGPPVAGHIKNEYEQLTKK